MHIDHFHEYSGTDENPIYYYECYSMNEDETYYYYFCKQCRTKFRVSKLKSDNL